MTFGPDGKLYVDYRGSQPERSVAELLDRAGARRYRRDLSDQRRWHRSER